MGALLHSFVPSLLSGNPVPTAEPAKDGTSRIMRFTEGTGFAVGLSLRLRDARSLGLRWGRWRGWRSLLQLLEQAASAGLVERRRRTWRSRRTGLAAKDRGR